MSEAAAAAPVRKSAAPEAGAKHELVLQRKCACGQHTLGGGECAECRKKRLATQRWSSHRPRPEAMVRGAASTSPAIAAPGGDLSAVRTQTPLLRTVPRIQRAEAGEGGAFDDSAGLEQAVEDAADPSSAPPSPEAASPGGSPEASEAEASPDTPSAGPGAALLVEDDAADVGTGQMRKTEFLDQLQRAVCAQADEALAAAGRSTEGCPFIAQAFGRYRGQSAARVESALRRYAPETRNARTAAEAIPILAARVRQGVERWVETGEITGVPDDAPISIPTGGLFGALGSVASGIGSLLFKAKEGGARPDDPDAVHDELGDGRPLESGVRGRMERAFGRSFSGVRMHTDATARRLSAEQNARAFTVGGHVAFGAGEYRPGTVAGDALIAHELAHTVQQGSGAAVQAKAAGAGYDALEADADRSAAGVVASLWGAAKETAGKLASNTGPALRSGLSIQRCSHNRAAAQSPTSRPATATTGCPPRLSNQNWDVVSTPTLVPTATGCSLRLAAGATEGFTFNADYEVQPPCRGRIYFVQNTRPSRLMVSCFENHPLGFCSRPQWGIDTGWPYGHGSNYDIDLAAGSETRHISSIDSPGILNVSNPDTALARVCIHDEFVTYVVFEDPAGALTPLAWMSWSWDAQAHRDRGVCTPAQSSLDCAGWTLTGAGHKGSESFVVGAMNPDMPLDRARGTVDMTPQDCPETDCPAPASAPAGTAPTAPR